jgi:HNH endonuclease
MNITQDLVRELVHYEARRGTLTWKPRDRRWFNSDQACRAWNTKYAGQPAFTYKHSGYRWGSLLNKNQLAHRIVWMYVHGQWPSQIVFRDNDATNLRLSNLYDKAPSKVVNIKPRIYLGLTQQPARKRVRLDLAA